MNFRIHFSPPPSLLMPCPDGTTLDEAEARSFKFVEDCFGEETAQNLQWTVTEEPSHEPSET